VQLAGPVRRSYVETLPAILSVPGLGRTRRAGDDCYRVRSVRHQRNAYGIPDLSSQGVDDRLLQRQQPAVRILLFPLEVFEVRLNAKHVARVGDAYQQSAAFAVEECRNRLRDAPVQIFLDLFLGRLRLPWVWRLGLVRVMQ
jgi:hypothetical protein